MNTRYLVSFLTLMITGSALAHPGHDHSHWSSPAVHAALLIAVAMVVGTGVWKLRKSLKARQK